MKPKELDRKREEGAALLAVLLLVAVMAALSSAALARMTLAARTGSNAAALEQARAFAFGAETYALLRVSDLSRLAGQRTTLVGGWHGSPIRVPVPGGIATAVVTDGGNCFNLNSVVRPANPFTPSGVGGPDAEPVFVANPSGIAQLVALLQFLAVPTANAQLMADGLADWIDTDAAPLPAGAEDDTYQRLPVPYRTAGRLLLHPSELRAVAGVTPETFAAAQPWLCALPVATPSPLNINTLLPEQAVLLASLLPGRLAPADARAVIERRPPTGWPSDDLFWQDQVLRGLNVSPDVRGQVVERTRWFRLRLDVELDGAQVGEVALIDGGGATGGTAAGAAGEAKARLVSRDWGQD